MDDEVQALVAEQVAYYRAHAPDYDDAYLGKDWDRCVEELPIAGDVLELACGTGHWTPLLAARARSVTAVDTHHPQPDKLDRRRAPAVIGSSPPKAAGSKALPAGGAVCP